MLRVVSLTAGDIPAIVAAEGDEWWKRDEAWWRRCLDEQSRGLRSTAIAYDDQRAVGYAHLLWKSDYDGFRVSRTPEITDLRVASATQRQGAATALILYFGRTVLSAGGRALGASVGLSEGYGAAQRLYAKLGFMPDGRGITHDNARVFPGDTVRADDTLLLWLVRELP